MNLTPKNQNVLYGLDKYFYELKDLYNREKLPNKILLSGQKGIGKSTLSYHLINFILSLDEKFPYDDKNFVINKENISYKLIANNSHPNFYLIDLVNEKKKIDISQVRELITYFNKSSFNLKPRFILIDNIEYLSINSANSLLKILEEPKKNVYFLLINNDKNVLDTLRSRCLNFRISLSYDKILMISNNLLKNNIFKIINKEFINYYFTPGKIYNLVKFSEEKNFDLQNLSLKNFLMILIDKGLYKKDTLIKNMMYDFIEIFLSKNILANDYAFYNYFLKKIDQTKKFNLDEESLFIEFESKVLNG